MALMFDRADTGWDHGEGGPALTWNPSKPRDLRNAPVNFAPPQTRQLDPDEMDGDYNPFFGM